MQPQQPSAPQPEQPRPFENTPEPLQQPVVTMPQQAQTPVPEDVEDYPVEDENFDEEPIYWEAQEYIHHEKNSVWFLVFGAIVLGLMALSFFVMNSLSFTILIPVMAVALFMYTSRPARTLNYTLNHQGLHVNDHLYNFSEFKGFGIVDDGEEYSLMLIPIKRFRPGVSVYFPEEIGEEIVDILGARLPMQELKFDLFAQVIRKLRL